MVLLWLILIFWVAVKIYRDTHGKKQAKPNTKKIKVPSQKRLLSSEKREGYQIDIYDCPRSRVKKMEIVLHYDIPGSDEWNITKEKFFTGMDRKKGSDDIQIGDIAFDRECLLSGDAEFLRSLLNAELREQIYDLHQLSEQFQVTSRNIMLRLKKEYINTPEKREALVRKIIETARVITREPDMFKRCLANAQKDPQPRFRIYNLGILHSRFSDRIESAQAIESALKDPDLDVRIYAAVLQGEKAQSLLGDILLNENLNVKQLRDIIFHMMNRDYTRSIPVIIKYYQKSKDLQVRLILLQGLRGLAHSSAQDFLKTELDSEQDRVIRIALVDTLGMCGDIPAVEYLYKWELAHPDAGLKDSIKRAISRIQSRQDVKGDKGWLSLNETGQSEGGLSLSHGDEGGLSMEEE